MKTFPEIDELAAEYAKEIVVAQLSSHNVVIDEENGKYIAEFYSAIFNGISETLKKSSIKDYDNV